ncbi:MAG: HAD-IIIA family hydrolase [Bacteroidetes bacterium]|nr:HAD-IIIA family hydrolase [Bacteroidota bacterium]
MKKAFFFDRDGIVNVKLENDYVKSIDEFVFTEGFFDFFKLIKEKNYIAILVTNQQCIAKNIINTDTLAAIHTYMQEELLKHSGYNFDDVYYCPDLDGTNSINRKPAIGMFTDAIKKHSIDARSSWTIGDSNTDIEAGSKAGTKTIYVNKIKNVKGMQPNLCFNNLAEVYEYFINLWEFK